jgi:hypothetical protein
MRWELDYAWNDSLAAFNNLPDWLVLAAAA